MDEFSQKFVVSLIIFASKIYSIHTKRYLPAQNFLNVIMFYLTTLVVADTINSPMVIQW